MVHGSSLAHVAPGNALLCWGQVPGAKGWEVPTPLTLQMLWFQRRKTEVKQSLVEQVAGRAVISLFLPQTHYLQESINPSVPKNTSSGFLWHHLTAAYLQLSKSYEPLLPPHCLLPLSPLFSVFPFPLFFLSCFFLFHLHYSPGKDGKASN